MLEGLCICCIQTNLKTITYLWSLAAPARGGRADTSEVSIVSLLNVVLALLGFQLKCSNALVYFHYFVSTILFSRVVFQYAPKQVSRTNSQNTILCDVS